MKLLFWLFYQKSIVVWVPALKHFKLHPSQNLTGIHILRFPALNRQRLHN